MCREIIWPLRPIELEAALAVLNLVFLESRMNPETENISRVEVQPIVPQTELPQIAKSRGFAATYGLDPRAAGLMVIVDLMISAMDTASFETLLPLGVAIATILGFVVYRIQRGWYGDEHDSAVTKGLIVGLLTAIPVPIAPLIAIPGGALGIVKALRRR
jgi:hypothetical protein